MTAPRYLQLNKAGTFGRMATLRAIVAESTTGNRPPSHAVADWRAARKYGFNNWAAAHGELDAGFNSENVGTKYEKKTPIWYAHSGAVFRGERFAQDVTNDDHCRAAVDHNGWYGDVDGNRLYMGLVARLSHGRFIAGYYCDDNNERVYFDEIFTDEYEAARFGDSEAEKVAEVDREYDERWRAAQEIADEIEQALPNIKRNFALRNHPDLGQDCRDELSLDITVLRNLRDTLANEYSDVEI